ncbi:MAG: hypothetical protein CM15mP33_04800 [Candidatus Neomarinimicrobiota bacterium]|nr:MAG: hypothetical protein CM15mP33_04800 [Candidatus Neomarinimicrobiota bacterium]
MSYASYNEKMKKKFIQKMIKDGGKGKLKLLIQEKLEFGIQ